MKHIDAIQMDHIFSQELRGSIEYIVNCKSWFHGRFFVQFIPGSGVHFWPFCCFFGLQDSPFDFIASVELSNLDSLWPFLMASKRQQRSSGKDLAVCLQQTPLWPVWAPSSLQLERKLASSFKHEMLIAILWMKRPVVVVVFWLFFDCCCCCSCCRRSLLYVC